MESTLSDGAGANIDEAYSQVPLDGGIWALGAGYASLEPFPPNQKTDFHVTLTKFSQGEWTSIKSETPGFIFPNPQNSSQWSFTALRLRMRLNLEQFLLPNLVEQLLGVQAENG